MGQFAFVGSVLIDVEIFHIMLGLIVTLVAGVACLGFWFKRCNDIIGNDGVNVQANVQETDDMPAPVPTPVWEDAPTPEDVPPVWEDPVWEDATTPEDAQEELPTPVWDLWQKTSISRKGSRMNKFHMRRDCWHIRDLRDDTLVHRVERGTPPHGIMRCDICFNDGAITRKYPQYTGHLN